MNNVTESPANNATLATWTPHSTKYVALSTTLTFAVCALGIVGNIMVIVVVLATKHMRTPINCYLVSLAVADLMVLMVAGVPSIISSIAGSWVLGHYGCGIITFLQYLSINASPACIMVITVERYITICHPVKAQTLCTMPRAKKVIAALWTITSLYCSMWLYLANIEEVVYANITLLTCGYRVARRYYLPIYFLDFGVFFVLPFLLFVVLYGMIAQVLSRRRGPSSTPSSDNEKPLDKGAESGDDEGSCSNRRRSRIVAARKQVTKMLAVVVILFALLWMPYRTLVVVNSILPQAYVNRDFLLFCRLCIYLNSAINPIIYNAMSPKFRAAFRQLFRCSRRAIDGQARVATSNREQSATPAGSSNLLDEINAANSPQRAEQPDNEAAAGNN